jgi:hypothetical protein
MIPFKGEMSVCIFQEECRKRNEQYNNYAVARDIKKQKETLTVLHRIKC